MDVQRQNGLRGHLQWWNLMEFKPTTLMQSKSRLKLLALQSSPRNGCIWMNQLQSLSMLSIPIELSSQVSLTSWQGTLLLACFPSVNSGVTRKTERKKERKKERILTVFVGVVALCWLWCWRNQMQLQSGGVWSDPQIQNKPGLMLQTGVAFLLSNF